MPKPTDNQQNNRKFKIWAIVLVLIIILLIALIWWLTSRRAGGPNTANENIPVFNAPSANITFQPVTPEEADDTLFGITTLSKTYAERFGSWSTDNQLKNLEDLKPLSTTSMQSFLASQEADYSKEGFYGITTKSISTNIVTQSESSAEVIVSTQRVENKDGSESTFYQDIKITMVYSQGAWLVSSAFWQ